MTKAPTIVIPKKKQEEVPPLTPSSINKMNKKSAFPEEVAESVIDSLPMLTLPSLPNFSNPFASGGKKVPTPPTKPLPRRSSTEESIASAIGGVVVGSGLGLYADVATDILSDTDLPGLVPPVAFGVALGIGAFVGAGQGNFVGTAIRFMLGGPVLGLRDNVRNAITRKVDEIMAAPGKFVDAVEQKIENTVDEIKATPG